MKPKIRFPEFTDDWEHETIFNIAPLRNGFAFKSSKFKNAGIPIVKISNILTNGKIGGKFTFYNKLKKDENFTLKNEDVIIAMSGATVGKISELQCENNKIFYQNQRVGYFQKNNTYDYNYAKVILKTNAFLKKLQQLFYNSSQPNISSKDINSFAFFISKNKNEQQKIGLFFKKFGLLISLIQEKIKILERIKTGFLQQMMC